MTSAMMSYTLTMQLEKATLSNGLTVISEVVPTAHTAAMGFFVKTGARDEESRMMGVSHFLEHMMFKGTDKRPAEVVDRQFDELGVDHNAYTSSELTAFYVHGLPEALAPAAEILSDIMRPALREVDFEAEKQVILEEIAMYRDHPFWVLYEKAMEVYYDKHPLAHRVLGTDETIPNLQRDEMMRYFNTRYSADNTVVAMAGRVDFDAMVQLIESYCGHWQRTEAKREYPPAPHTQQEFTIHDESITRHYMLMLAPAPAINDRRRYAAGILASILGDHEGSRLYWSLVEPGTAEEAQAQYDGRDGLGDTLIYAVCSPKDAQRVKEIIAREVEQLASSLTEDDLMRVRSKVATGATLQSELPGGRMRRLGRLWTYTGEYRSLDEELSRINAVTLKDLREVAQAFPLSPVVTAHLTSRQGSPVS